MTIKSGWSDAQVAEFARDLRRTLRGGWSWMTVEVRLALVEQRVLHITMGLDRENVDVDAIRSLRMRLVARMNLENDT